MFIYKKTIRTTTADWQDAVRFGRIWYTVTAASTLLLVLGLTALAFGLFWFYGAECPNKETAIGFAVLLVDAIVIVSLFDAHVWPEHFYLCCLAWVWPEAYLKRNNHSR